MTCLFIDTLTTFTPISLFRHISAVHRFTSPKGTVKNRSVINDLTVRVGGAVLASAVYGLVVLICYRSWLAVHLVIYFEGIRDISATHSADHISLVALFLPLGWAAREFIFTPAVGAKPDAHDKKTAAFNPETATLSETMEWNFWGFSKKTRVLVERTATAAAIGGLHTWVQAYFTIEGVEAYGAAGWAIIWVFAAIATGTAFSWVANYDGV